MQVTKNNNTEITQTGKAKDKTGESYFCANGHLWQRIKRGNILTCGCEAIRGPTYGSVVKRMRIIIKHNRNFIEKKIFFEDEKDSCKFPLKIGSKVYFVPLRYFIELDNIEATDHSQYDRFFEFIKSTCQSEKI